jgi:hypothetical protein
MHTLMIAETDIDVTSIDFKHRWSRVTACCQMSPDPTHLQQLKIWPDPFKSKTCHSMMMLMMICATLQRRQQVNTVRSFMSWSHRSVFVIKLKPTALVSHCDIKISDRHQIIQQIYWQSPSSRSQRRARKINRLHFVLPACNALAQAPLCLACHVEEKSTSDWAEPKVTRHRSFAAAVVTL